MSSKAPKNSNAASLSMEEMFILDQCALIETRCAEFYRHFARITSDIPELENVWQKTALEEDHHALQFKMLARLKEGIKLKADLSKVNSALQQLDDLFARIENSKLTAVDTLQVGIRLEGYLSQYHCNSIVACDDPEMARLLDAMMRIDVEHTEMLQRVLDRLTQKAPQHPDPTE